MVLIRGRVGVDGFIVNLAKLAADQLRRDVTRVGIKMT